jgi:UDPglucose--hexose-1-phosphate uridylyltransferase
VLAPGRLDRPGAKVGRIPEATPEELAACPFCAGREHETPPELLRLPAGAADWRVRVVPNRYPAFERHEVVVHSARHVRSFAELARDEVALVAAAWRLRREASRPGYLHACVNEGPAAGATQRHSHSQLVLLDDVPPAAVAERGGRCGVCAELGLSAGALELAEREGIVLRTAFAGATPYELVIAPRQHAGDVWRDPRLAIALDLLAEAIRRLRAVEGPVAWNAWLRDSAHWRIAVVPRLTVAGGIELGTGVHVNPLPPERAAEALRAAAAPDP